MSKVLASSDQTDQNARHQPTQNLKFSEMEEFVFAQNVVLVLWAGYRPNKFHILLLKANSITLSETDVAM